MELTKNLTLGIYLPTQSLVHYLDPRTKIIAAALLIALAFFVEIYVGYAFYLLSLYFLLLLCRIPLGFAL